MPAAPAQPFRPGSMETKKFAHRREGYWQGLEDIFEMGYSPADLVHQAPAFAGEISLARTLALYEAYKATLGVAGHIAEFGIWHGTNVILFAKLARLFEPCSLTLVHGFDWFQGSTLEALAKDGAAPAYCSSYDKVAKLVSLQGLDDVIRLHDMDLTTPRLSEFMAEYPHLQFKMVMLDCGIYEVVRNCIEQVWPRLTPGGWLILDNFNHETAPGEAQAARELLPDLAWRTFPFCAQPTAYAIKPAR